MVIQMSPEQLCEFKSLRSPCRLQSWAFVGLVGWWLVPYLVKCRRATQTTALTLLHCVTVVKLCQPDQTSVPDAHPVPPTPNSDQSQPQSLFSLFISSIHCNPLPSSAMDWYPLLCVLDNYYHCLQCRKFTVQRTLGHPEKCPKAMKLWTSSIPPLSIAL